MLQLTKRAEYGLIALVHLVDRGDDFVSAREISDRYPVPRRLLAEVLKDLCRAGFLDSLRGATGGYALSRPAERISLGEVVSALEGAPAVTGCENLGAYVGGSCDVESVCPIRSPLSTLRAGLWDLLQQTSLRDLARGSIAPQASAGTSPPNDSANTTLHGEPTARA